MEQIVLESGLDWVIARPPILKNGVAKGNVKVLEARKTGHVIMRADLAVWLVEQLESEAYVGQAIVVVNS